MSQTAKRFRALAITLAAIMATNFAISFATNLKSGMTAVPDGPRPKSGMTAVPDGPRPRSGMTAVPDAPRPRSGMTAVPDGPRP